MPKYIRRNRLDYYAIQIQRAFVSRAGSYIFGNNPISDPDRLWSLCIGSAIGATREQWLRRLDLYLADDAFQHPYDFDQKLAALKRDANLIESEYQFHDWCRQMSFHSWWTKQREDIIRSLGGPVEGVQ